MKRQLFIFLLLGIELIHAQVTGINTTNAAGTNASALLEIKSTTGGFLPPRMTQTERNAIATPATGLLIYNTTANSYETYNGTAWFSVNSKDINPTSSAKTIVSSYQFGTPTGQLKVGTDASGVSIPLTITVSQIGTSAAYSFSTTTSNGVTFSASGTFSSTGVQTITLIASGTPQAVGFYTFTLKNNITPYSFTLPVIDNHTVVGAAGKIWMAYNLGATAPATSATDYTQYGSLYQWGRGNDGHQFINWTSATAGNPVNGNTSTLSATDNPRHGLFIVNVSGTFDWLSPQNNTLWQGINGVNNPCPAGFRIPTEAELTAEVTAAGITSIATAYASNLKLVAAGYHKYDSGSLSVTGIGGYYWSSTTNGIYSHGRYFINGSTVNNSNYVRTYGFSVRCLKD